MLRHRAGDNAHRGQHAGHDEVGQETGQRYPVFIVQAIFLNGAVTSYNYAGIYGLRSRES